MPVLAAAPPAAFDLNRLRVFAAVVHCKSFTAAAAELGLSKGRVSEQVTRLERDLGRGLFVRTTRRMELTDAGRELHEQCAPLIQGLQAAVAGLRQQGSALAGTLRLATTADHAALYLAPALPAFMRLHPGLELELRISDLVVDLVRDGIDVAVRGGNLPDSSLKARRLGSFEPYLLASPAYVLSRGLPREPDDLRAHDWVTMKQLQSPQTLRLNHNGRSRTVRVQARLRVDAASAMRAVLEAGGGIGALDQHSALHGLASGRLVRVLPAWGLPRVNVHAVYPAAKVIPPATRAFVDYYTQTLKAAWQAR